MTTVTSPPATAVSFGWVPMAYRPVWHAMQRLTATRDDDAPDEIWLLNHAPVFTQGRNGRPEHVLAPGDIEVVPIDRGGQVTYHGPGQLMVYTLLDLKRLGIGIRSLVTALENTMIATLADHDIAAHARRDAPGVYVNAGGQSASVAEAGNQKIGSIGLRVSRGRSYHGLALNVDMDLEPFSRIDPCGYHGLTMTQMTDWAGPLTMTGVADVLLGHLAGELGLDGLVRTNAVDASDRLACLNR